MWVLYQVKRGLPGWASPLSFGGADRDRTGGLQSAILALSQLSYCPVTLDRRAHGA